MTIKGMRHTYMAPANEDGEPGSGGEAVVETDEPAESSAPDVEAEALKMGWSPKDQFKGDPSKWRPADEFVERGKNLLPILQATSKRQAREIDELKQSVRQFAEFSSKAEARGAAQAMAALKAQRAEAIAAGDGATFDKADEAIDELKQAQARQAKDQGPNPDYVEWAKSNPWVNTDPQLLAYAEAQGEYLQRTQQDLSYPELLERVSKAVKKEFPEKFENPRRAAAPSVEGGAPAARKGGKSFADMPADARAACERMARNGYADKPKEAAEFKKQYVAQYFEEA